LTWWTGLAVNQKNECVSATGPALPQHTMAHGTRVPNIQPLPQANTMEQMSAVSDPRLMGSQFTEANDAIFEA